MRALITGGTGFVGPHLVAHCIACGDDVVEPGDHTTGFDITSADAVQSTFEELQPEVVYHLAAWSDVGGSWRDPGACFRINVTGTANVLAAAYATGARRVLVVGSSEEYGRAGDGLERIPELAPLEPLTPYGTSKVAAAWLAVQAHAGHRGLETVRTRTFSHTGPGQDHRFVVPAIARRIAEAERDGATSIPVGALEPIRDLSDVRDVVRAYRLVMTRGAAGDVYNICRGEGVTIGDIAHRLVALATTSLELDADPDLIRPVEVVRLVGDPAKLHAATEWQPQYTLDDTLTAVLAEARERAHDEPA
jgi:GDP-4-dehydro-6-deoxy-D-mannose reductase